MHAMSTSVYLSYTNDVDTLVRETNTLTAKGASIDIEPDFCDETVAIVTVHGMTRRTVREYAPIGMANR